MLLNKTTNKMITHLILSVTTGNPVYKNFINHYNNNPEHFAAHISYRKCCRLILRYARLYLGKQDSFAQILLALETSIELQFKFVTLIWLLRILVQDEFFTEIPITTFDQKCTPYFLKQSFALISDDVKNNWTGSLYPNLCSKLLGQIPGHQHYCDITTIGRNITTLLQQYNSNSCQVKQDLLSGKYGFTSEDVRTSSLECSAHILAKCEKDHTLLTRLSTANLSSDLQNKPDDNLRYIMLILLIYANNINLKTKSSFQSFNPEKPRQKMIFYILAGFNQYVVAAGKQLDLLLPAEILKELRTHDLKILLTSFQKSRENSNEIT